MTQQTLSIEVVNIANDALVIEEIIMPKVQKVLNEARELGNIQMTLGMAAIHAMTHNIISETQGLALMLNQHII